LTAEGGGKTGAGGGAVVVATVLVAFDAVLAAGFSTAALSAWSVALVAVAVDPGLPPPHPSSKIEASIPIPLIHRLIMGSG